MSLMLFLCLMAVVGNRAAFAQTTWAHAYGGADFEEEALSIQQTNDGGYIVAGLTSSFGAGSGDSWVLKLDAGGTVTWQRTYGGAGDDGAYSIQQTSDGGYIVAGWTSSFGAGSGDFWVLKLDAGGNVTWQRTYGGAGDDRALSIQQTNDGGYIVAGFTYSFGAGSEDFWVLKLDGNGEMDTSCTFISNTFVSPIVSTATVTDTSAGNPSTSAAITDTGVTGVESLGTDTFICGVIQVTIDIKPGSFPNSINLGSAGVIPVAILSSSTFDATTVNPATVSLAGARVKLVGKSDKYLAHEEDVNGDGILDLVCQVLTAQFIIEPGDSVAVLEAETYDGTPIRGEDTVRIVQD